MKSFRDFFRAHVVPVCGCMVILLAITGCHQDNFADTRASDERSLRSLDSQWSKTATAHDLDGTVAFYADGAVLLPADEPIATSKAAIRASWAGTLDAFAKLSWEIKTIDVAKAGDLAYLTGAWTGALKGPNGRDTEVTGKLLEVWKKQTDGQWKCVADTYNSDAPLTPAPNSKK